MKREEVESWAEGLTGETPRARQEVLHQIVEAAAAGENISAASEALWDAAKRAKATSVNGLTTQHGAGEALAAHAAYSGDTQTVQKLYDDTRPALREGAFLGLSRVRGSRLGALLPILAKGLDDDNGAIVMCSIRALGNVVAEGGELGVALGPLQRQLKRRRYPEEGWKLGPSVITPLDLVEASPSADASWVLTEHYVRRRDQEGLDELLEHAAPFVRGNTINCLEHLASQKDDVRRRWIERFLEERGADR